MPPISGKAGDVMSGVALIWAANVKGLKPAAKIVLIQLADFHNKETNQCNPSAQRLASECEMGRATLFRHLTTLEDCGLITRHARGDGDGGRGSNQYELHLDITLGPSARAKEGGRDQNGVSSQNETGGKVSKGLRKRLKDETGVVSNRDTNLTIEPVKEPPSREREVADEIGMTEFDLVLAAYPEDRIRNPKASLRFVAAAISNGVDAGELRGAVLAYAAKTAGFTRSKVCFSDNWFKMRRWEVELAQIKRDQQAVQDAITKGRANVALWIEQRHPLCRHITGRQLEDLLDAELVTIDQAKAAGLGDLVSGVASKRFHENAMTRTDTGGQCDGK
jgi:hypothetical protein